MGVPATTIIGAYRGGHSLRAIGARFGTTTVWSILNRHGEPRRGLGEWAKPPTQAELARDASVVAAYREGQSLNRISRSRGIGKTLAWNIILLRHGEPRRTGRQHLMADGRGNADIVTAYRRGRTRQHLAAEFGCGSTRYCASMGWSLLRRSLLRLRGRSR
jgi:hypothetical protein